MVQINIREYNEKILKMWHTIRFIGFEVQWNGPGDVAYITIVNIMFTASQMFGHTFLIIGIF